jgi:hypothetical protein
MTAAIDTGAASGADRHYTLTRLPGWLRMVDAPAHAQPRRLSRAELAALSRGDRLAYNDSRAVWHANLGPIRTPQLLALHDGLAEIVETNRQDGDKNKPAALVDAYPGLGKTTAVLDYARSYHRQQITLHSDTTPDGHRRVPVVYLALSGNTQVKGLNEAICRFYGLPTNGTTDRLAGRAVDAVPSMHTTVMVIDDIHFLDARRRDSRLMSNHLKFLSNAFPVTLIYIGVGWPPAASSTKDCPRPRPSTPRSGGAPPRSGCRRSWSTPTTDAANGGGCCSPSNANSCSPTPTAGCSPTTCPTTSTCAPAAISPP